ncbi:saccharopine dehydrogenase NADP-binding domain-containing protein [Candidatus Peregrinibacteria bacterium]|nr:saccharopine dehydrogenase NADP-binding domain-containing protein [Candidatus Peregrinibacteria bacterium]
MHSLPFPGRILFLGFGGVARCTLPLVLRHLDVRPSRITVMDMADCTDAVAPYIAQGCVFLRERLERETYASQLSGLVSRGDIIIDLAWNIACTDMLQWCHEHGVLYINTSVELWNPYEGKTEKHPTERTLYPRHMAIRALAASWKHKGPTAVLEHGANPGLVSHFMKTALRDIAVSHIALDPDDHGRPLRDALDRENFPELAKLLQVQTIHISEIDTQETTLPDDPAVFLNTWSVQGLYEEGIAPAEMGWGTHERGMPPGACEHATGPKNQICLKSCGIDTFVRTRVPSGEITGMVVRHGEAFTISDYLTVRDATGIPVYRPTVHYAYCPCPAARRSLRHLRENGYKEPESWRIMGDDIVSGRDELGVLLLGPFGAWWTGTILDIEEARRLVPHQNATTLQVAASVLAAVVFMIRHPEEGVLVPEALPYKEILAHAAPYLGLMPSKALDWSPDAVTAEDAWQFTRLLTDPSRDSLWDA